MDTTTLIIAIVGGFIAGCINTLAGNGSAITLSILTELVGLPGNIANATNRVGIFFQGLASSFSFIKNKKLSTTHAKWPIIISIIGALAGAYVAMTISNEHFAVVFRYLLIIMLLLTLINPKRWLSPPTSPQTVPFYVLVPIYLGIGFYGGFIQMGMGVIFLFISVMVLRYNIISANAIKTTIVAIYTGVVLCVFHWKGLVDWRVGFILASGQTIGGYITAEWASKYKYADRWAYGILIVVLIWAILSTWGLLI